MIHQTTCDRCGKPVSIKWTDDDIKSMEDLGVDWKGIEGRCEACQEQLEIEHGYRRAQAKPESRPLSEAEIKARIPISKIAGARNDAEAVYLSPDQVFPE